MIIVGALPLWITNKYAYSIIMLSIGLTKMRDVEDLFVFFHSINSKKLFQLIKNNVDMFDLRNYFVILFAHVGLIKSSKDIRSA